MCPISSPNDVHHSSDGNAEWGGTGNPENFCPEVLEAGIRQGTRAGQGGALIVSGQSLYKIHHRKLNGKTSAFLKCERDLTDLFGVQDKIREKTKKGVDSVIGSLTASITKLHSWFGGGGETRAEHRM